ncbi:MAG: SDR family oxidoreductase [Anaerolineaceae bacterium]|jgi:NAD(P)-dependent dehydrogenase (short-subunit alcohol dehydrogenase family)|nr:SDR family oxidoreductase [Anaerolineaceae bacterium]
MKTVVVTGSTRGIGRGLAEAFLKHGCAVVVNGRNAQSVDETVTDLAGVCGTDRVFGQACDVAHADQVQALWDAACAKFGSVDIWINNAGVTHDALPFWSVDMDRVEQVFDVNVLGSINGLRTAYRGMAAQGGGSIYNMEGLGSGKRAVKGLAFYESSKSAVTKLTQTAVLDAEGSAVKIGYLSPGMVITDLLVGEEQSGEKWERKKRIYNILADRVETVAPFLAEEVLKNETHGAKIAWLTPWKSFMRFLKAPFVKRDLFAEEE